MVRRTRRPSAQEIAEFDQGMTAATDLLSQLITAYIDDKITTEKVAEEYKIMALAGALAQEWPAPFLASTLTAAIVILAEESLRQERATG